MTAYSNSQNLPYPTGSDLVTDGDDAIKALADAVDAKLDAIDLRGVWQDYTPLWTGDGSTKPTKGNATLTGRWTTIGKTVHFQIFFQYGSTSVGGNGGWYFSLPVPARPLAAGACINSTGSVVDQGLALYQVTGAGALLTVAGVDYTDVKIPSGTGRTAYNVGTTQPFTFGAGDTVGIAGSYEAA